MLKTEITIFKSVQYSSRYNELSTTSIEWKRGPMCERVLIGVWQNICP